MGLKHRNNNTRDRITEPPPPHPLGLFWQYTTKLSTKHKPGFVVVVAVVVAQLNTLEVTRCMQFYSDMHSVGWEHCACDRLFFVCLFCFVVVLLVCLCVTAFSLFFVCFCFVCLFVSAFSLFVWFVCLFVWCITPATCRVKLEVNLGKDEDRVHWNEDKLSFVYFTEFYRPLFSSNVCMPLILSVKGLGAVLDSPWPPRSSARLFRTFFQDKILRIINILILGRSVEKTTTSK